MIKITGTMMQITVPLYVKGEVLMDGHNNVYCYDFANGSVSTPYDKAMSSLAVRTKSSGRSKVLLNGEVFRRHSSGKSRQQRVVEVLSLRVPPLSERSRNILPSVSAWMDVAGHWITSLSNGSGRRECQT